MPFQTTVSGTINVPGVELGRGSFFQQNHLRMKNAWKGAQRGYSQARGFVGQQTVAVKNWLRTGPAAEMGLTKAYTKLFSGPGHKAGMEGIRTAFGLHTMTGTERASILAKTGRVVPKQILGRALGIGFTAYATYEGYQKEGVWGAAKGAAGSAAEWYLMNRIFATFGGPGLALGVGLGAAYGAYKIPRMLNEAVNRHRQQYEGTSFGGRNLQAGQDPFGNNATMRQRGLLAIQNSRLNARSGLGMEALMTFRPSHL